jgi:hypothetical protein
MSFILLGILNSQVEAGGAAAYDLLETTVLGTTASSVTFSSLGSYSDYKHLQIRATMRANGTTLTFYRIRLNGDTGTNYARHWLTSQGTSVTSAAGTSTNAIFPADRLPGDSTANSFTASVMDFLDFSNANKNTTVKVFSGYRDAVNGGQIRLASGLWNNTAAVTSIEVSTGTDSFVAGSRFSLYGIK